MSEPAIPQRPIVDQLIETTCQIRCTTFDGKSGTGTGFNVNIDLGDGNYVPVIITNRHVLENYHWAEITFNEASATGERTEKKLSVQVPIYQTVVYHPDPSVDLAAIKIASTMNKLRKSEIELYRLAIDVQDLSRDEFLEECLAIEEVLVVGYPSGIRDEYNNFPIVRRGVTATPVNSRYQGKNQFLIDCAVFPGSSGSPVFLYSTSMRQSRKGGGFSLGKVHFGFVGVLAAVYEHPIHGDVLDVPVPVPVANIAITRVPSNLGICINARMVLELTAVLKEHGQNEIASRAA